MPYKVLPPPPDLQLQTFYPQSLGFVHRDGRGDSDIVTPEGTYALPGSQRLVVGKYVSDPNNEDPSNPKYVAPAGSRLRSRLQQVLHRQNRCSRSSYNHTEEEGSSAEMTTSDVSLFGNNTNNANGNRTNSYVSSNSDGLGIAKMRYPVVEPIYPFSSCSLFFPIHYSRLGDHTDSPGCVNKDYHGVDRPNLKLGSVSVQKNNLNRMCLYKIGPGAVAFKVVICAFEAAGMKYTPSNELFNVIWAKRATPYTLSHLGPYQKVNHFPGTWGIGRKDSLATNIRKMQGYFGFDAFEITPASFIIPKQQAELEEYAKRQSNTDENPLVFIVKPTASSCGRGIRLYRGMPPIPPEGTRQLVCQRYIGNPMLIYGRKFDLRMYCVVTSFDPLRIYLFDEGLVRFAAEKYRGMDKDLGNVHIHLTNYSVNKTAELNRASRGKQNDSDDPIDIKWCLSDLRNHLLKTQADGAAVWKKILRGCEDVVIKAFLSIEHDVVERLRRECRDKTGRGCFELFGLDLMADDQHRVRLIEVNIMPSLATGTTLDKAVKSRMLAHLLTLIRVIPFQRDALADANNSPLLPTQRQQEDQQQPQQRHSDVRYAFGRHPQQSGAAVPRKTLINRFNDPDNPDSMLSNDEYLMLVEAEEELACAGGFRRIFPTAENVRSYLPYFTHGVLRNNYLLASAVRMQAKATR